MKTVKKFSSTINLLIFVLFVSTGTILGSTLGHLSYGVLLGIACGLIGINGFHYYLELLAMKQEKNTMKIESRGDNFKRAA